MTTKLIGAQCNKFFQKPHPYASLSAEQTTRDPEEFDPIVRISTHHDKKTHLKQPDLNLAEYYYESMNEADNEAEVSSGEAIGTDTTYDTLLSVT